MIVSEIIFSTPLPKLPIEKSHERIRWARLKLGLTQAQVATASGLTVTTIINLEKRGTSNLATLSAIQEILQQPICYLGCFENMPENTFSQRLKKARYWHGLTHKEAALFLNINESQYRELERGRRKETPENMKDSHDFIAILYPPPQNK